MPVFTVYALGASQISVSGGEQLSGITQGDGSHLVGETITLNSNLWEAVSIDDNDSDFDDNDTGQTLNGAQSFDGVSYASGRIVEAEYELTLRDPDGNTYTDQGFNIREPGGGASYATVEGLSFTGGVGGFPPTGVPLTVVSAREGPSEPYADLATPPCFVAGTLIETPRGPVAVEALAAGDMVVTADHGAQPLRWVGCARIPAALIAREPAFRPVVIRQDALGEGRPAQDLHLSQQHRVLIGDWRAEVMFGHAEILVAARKLVNDRTILLEAVTGDVTYYHLLFDRHEIVLSNGLPTESYLPDPDAPRSNPTEREVMRLFPQLAIPGRLISAARPCIEDRRVRVLAA
ncbi:Hint domain-containing protein [Roseovarius sp. SCSIO 43702]|uniref:Hint domain-containing protein n=1 Tax=Roseovarius sp. SCSIO 43702 TaxID=2823043 RepID=UPI001C737E5B|nr:Hint domain-containing protein [Roseovarius sp. SCSIO 43702]QYX56416.1 Hint domain-containing protein [Roseovarius sp. SCSIO 43702]